MVKVAIVTVHDRDIKNVVVVDDKEVKSKLTSLRGEYLDDSTIQEYLGDKKYSHHSKDSLINYLYENRLNTSAHPTLIEPAESVTIEGVLHEFDYYKYMCVGLSLVTIVRTKNGRGALIHEASLDDIQPRIDAWIKACENAGFVTSQRTIGKQASNNTFGKRASDNTYVDFSVQGFEGHEDLWFHLKSVPIGEHYISYGEIYAHIKDSDLERMLLDTSWITDLKKAK